MFRSIFIVIICFCFAFFGCQKKEKKDSEEFVLIDRGSYTTRTINDTEVFIKDKKVMNGYYVVGNKFDKWEEFEVKDGILNGKYILFHPNGQKSSLTNYSNGKKHGIEHHFYLSGELSKALSYSNNKLIGKTTEYYEGGAISKESKLKNEDIIESISYNNVGVIIGQMFISDGIKINQYLKNGKLFCETLSSTYDDNEAIKFYNEDGTLKHYLKMFEVNEQPFIAVLDMDGIEIKKINLKSDTTESRKYLALIGPFY